MVFVSGKQIRGKTRYYLEKSVRLSDGKVKKYSVYLKNYSPGQSPLPEAVQRLEKKVFSDAIELAPRAYRQNRVFTADVLKKLERIRIAYADLVKKLTPAQWSDILDRFAVNFTYESNAIEGNSLTLKDVTFILKEGKVVMGNKDVREIYETINTREALGLVFDKKLSLTESDIIHLHGLLVQQTGIATGYKKLPNFLLGRRVKTTPPEKIKTAMASLLADYHHGCHFHPLRRAADFHGLFEQIHPFEDGNGRVGRLLILSILLAGGYPPLIIRKTQRVAYFAALEAFDGGHRDKLYRFLIEKYVDTYRKFFEIYVKYL